jgi:hypothetical protein
MSYWIVKTSDTAIIDWNCEEVLNKSNLEPVIFITHTPRTLQYYFLLTDNRSIFIIISINFERNFE